MVEQIDQQKTWSEGVGKQVPNWLTALRFALVPVFVWLMTDPTPSSGVWATGIFILAAVTDWLDGYLARLFKAESIIGTVLDPLADKILVMAALVLLAARSDWGVPAWMVIVILAREMIITGLRSLAALKSIVVPASRTGKHKTAWTMVAVVLLLLGGSFKVCYSLGFFALWIALLLTVISGIQYAYSLRRVFEF